MKYRPFFSSIAFRLPFTILFICGLVASLSLTAIYGLTKARTQMASYGSAAFASLAKASTISRQTSSLLLTAPFLVDATSPYRLSNESLEIARRIDELMRYISSQPPEVFGDLERDDRGQKALALLSIIREETLGLSANAKAADKYKRMATANIGWLNAKRANAILESKLGVELNRIGLSAAASESLLHLGEMRRKFLKASQSVRSNTALPGTGSDLTQVITKYDRLFEVRKEYLSRISMIRTSITRLRTVSRELAAATEAHTAGTGQALNSAFASTDQTLTYLRGMILAASLLVMALSAFAIYSVIRISRAIMHISDSMHQLARGEKDAVTPRFAGPETELQKLVHAFAAFKATVDRVTQLRGTAQAAARTIRSTFRSMNDGIAIFDRGGRPVTMNRRMMELMHASASARKLHARFFAAGIKELDPELLPNGEEDTGTLSTPVVVRSRSIGQRVLEISLTRQPGERIVMLARDITEADRQEANARRLQRLNGMIEMTHQVSHEVGNMIGIITGSLGMLEKAGSLGTKQQRHVARIRKAAERGKSLANSMLSIASQQTLAPIEADVGSLLYGMFEILEMATGPICTVRLDLRKPLPPVYLDPAAFEQAVLNLCLNAATAMPEGGEILVVAHAQNDMLAVKVQDNGIGMLPEVVDHAFEPYFTTRKNQGGTGLGLAIVYGFVRQSRGQISIHSRLGEGTKVEMLFPMLSEGMENLDGGELPGEM
ncbi:MAG: two-component sensor histidine kinase [Ensifer alkalisoli]|nr:two-component sensor histidine kinase [Sinorhizobium alkalisoli]